MIPYKKLTKTTYNVLGIMSGTSMDGIDISLIKTNGTDYVKVINEKSYNYSLKLQNKIKNIVENKPIDESKIEKYFYNNENVINEIYINFIKKFLKQFKINIYFIHLISLSGQTVYHNPLKRISIQLGSGKVIANEFKIVTVSNLRDNDIKNKGQGAPIGSYYHKYILNKFDNKSIIINLGGIANFTGIKKRIVISSDIGPANCIIDDLSNYFFKKKFDRDGIFSTKGSINNKILNDFKKDKFFYQKIPKSLDRNYFNKYKKKLIKINKYDALCTATNMILIGIQKFSNNYKYKFNRIILTGGGRKNKYLLKILKDNITHEIILIDKLKINGDLVEAQMFAYLGVRSLKKLTISGKYTTGVKNNISGGKIYLPNS